MIMYEYDDFWEDTAVGKRVDLKIAIEEGYGADKLRWNGIYFDAYGEKAYFSIGR